VGVGRSDVYGQHHRPNSLERRLIVVLVDGTVTTSAVSSETTSGGDEPFGEDVSVVLAVRVEDEEDECEGDLGSARDQLMFIMASRGSHLHVKNSVSDDLGVDRDLVGSLGQSPNDGVCGPKTGCQLRMINDKAGGLTQQSSK
jgi:hypothetical protein